MISSENYGEFPLENAFRNCRAMAHIVQVKVVLCGPSLIEIILSDSKQNNLLMIPQNRKCVVLDCLFIFQIHKYAFDLCTRRFFSSDPKQDCTTSIQKGMEHSIVFNDDPSVPSLLF